MALRGLTERAQALEQRARRRARSAAGSAALATSRLGAMAPQVAERVAAARERSVSALSRGLAAKLPELEGQVESVLREHHELESTFEEKTQLGRREAEDIRSQIAPLLEDRVRRHESDAMLFSEMERLRENLAESLHDLAERVRSRVRKSERFPDSAPRLLTPVPHRSARRKKPLVVSPVGLHAHGQLQVEAPAELLLELLARGLADVADHGAALADHDALLALALDHDRGA